MITNRSPAGPRIGQIVAGGEVIQQEIGVTKGFEERSRPERGRHCGTGARLPS